jgi:phenylacetate-coenzyme A ligase PaaK-like adenylate-forming protein
VIVESVDAEYRPVPTGESGSTTLITNLANHVQPIVRCDLGDRVRLHEGRCACGSALPVIEVEGREDDSLVFVDARGRPVRLLPLALTTVMEEEARVFDFQLVQRDEQELLLLVAASGREGEQALERSRAALLGHLRAQGLDRVTIQARCGEAGTRGRSGKVQRVVAATAVAA